MPVDELARMKAAGNTPVDAYSMAVAGGYTGTKEQFEADLAASETNASNAASSATAAAGSAESVLPFALNYAPAYSSSGTYAEGDMAVYDGLLYECTEEITAGEEFDPSKWVYVPIMPSATELNGEIEAFKQRTADSIHSSASGAIAHFTDGANGAKMDSVVVGIDPVQDLHGYDSPWPAGGGKNLVSTQPVLGTTSPQKLMDFGEDKTGTWRFTFYLNNVSWVNTSSALFSIKNNAGTHTYFTPDRIYRISDSKQLSSITQPVTGRCTILLSNKTFQSLWSFFMADAYGKYSGTITDVQLEEGSAITDYAPYANVCPISGFTGAKVTRTGKNLLPYNLQYYSNLSNLEFTKAIYLKQGNYSISFGETTATNWRYFIKAFNADGTVRTNGTDITSPAVNWRDGFGGYLSGSNGTSKCIFFTVNADAYYAFCIGFGTNADTTYSSCQLELGSTATAYEPYAGQTYDITFPSEAGTVYGGTLDAVSGVLTVDRAYDQMTYSYLSGLNSDYIGYSDNIQQVGGHSVWVRNWNYQTAAPRKNGGIKACCNAFGVSMHNTNIFSSQYRTYFGVGSISSVAEFLSTVQALEAGGSGLYICYELATPLTYQLTPTQVTTLLGTNNVWADTGDTAVEYIADTKLYIEQLTKPGEDDMTANANIASGKFFIIGNRLFLSTTAIAQGAAIVPGTNCTEISLADALNQIGEN